VHFACRSRCDASAEEIRGTGRPVVWVLVLFECRRMAGFGAERLVEARQSMGWPYFHPLRLRAARVMLGMMVESG
jgi:hypothetical protein